MEEINIILLASKTQAMAQAGASGFLQRNQVPIPSVPLTTENERLHSMRATVQMLNSKTGMVAAQTMEGDYTVFELLGDEVEIGDVVEGNLHSLGGESFLNVSQRQRVEVFVQAIQATRQNATHLVRGHS